MRKIVMLALANIRKAKSQTVSFFLIIVITSLLLNLGLVTLLNYGDNFDNKYKELNSAHVWYAMNSLSFKNEYLDYAKNIKGVTDVEKRDVLFFRGNSTFGDSDLERNYIIFDADSKYRISKVSFVEKLDSLPTDAIYLPYIEKTGGNIKLGDKFTIEASGEKNNFTVAGFYEEMNTGTINQELVGFMLPHKGWVELKNKAGGAFDGTMLFARINDKSQGKSISSEIYNYISANSVTSKLKIEGSFYENLKQARTTTAKMGTAIIILFSLIIMLVSLIIIRFRIKNSIEEDIYNIGALKAMGYTSRQLISSTLLQFTGMAFVAGLLGGVLTIFALPALKSAFTVQTGIIWDQDFDLKSFLISFIFIILVTVLVSLHSARGIRKLAPITALRNGINTHNFRKNHFPLEKTSGNLNFILSIKVMIQNIRQNIMISVIIAAVCFTSVFALVMYYNIAYDDKAFADTITGEYPTAVVMLDSNNYNENIIKSISKMPEVRKIIYYDRASALYNNTEPFKVYVTDDYSVTENKKCYEGRDPIHDNEIALNGYMAELTGKKIKDTIKIKVGNNTYEYLITGFLQTANGADYDSEMTTAGYRQIYPDYKPLSIYIYLKDGTDTPAFLDNIKAEYGKYMTSYMDAMKMKETMLGVFVNVVKIIAYVIIFITFLIIVLVLFLIIKAMIIKRKRYLGISKALGFRTSQLVLQISLGFIPVALTGSIAGGLAGYFGINPLMSMAMKSMGIMKMNLYIPPVLLIILCSVICIFTFLIATLVSIRIRKISAVSLITE